MYGSGMTHDVCALKGYTRSCNTRKKDNFYYLSEILNN